MTIARSVPELFSEKPRGVASTPLVPARVNPRPHNYGVSPPSPEPEGVGATPLGVSKRSVVEFRGKDQQIALAEYSQLVVLFLVPGQYLTQLFFNNLVRMFAWADLRDQSLH